ncbi:hypothetical protein [Streptomyces sp. NPDC004134]|uniref:hypothetical protein n=1 Tax=Streptomyces sp. NPDC004134 TaxID=3364691 RepID=UPI0036A7F1FC
MTVVSGAVVLVGAVSGVGASLQQGAGPGVLTSPASEVVEVAGVVSAGEGAEGGSPVPAVV